MSIFIIFLAALGSRKKINVPDSAEFWFVCKAHPPVHIGGYVLVDATPQTDQRASQMVHLFFSEALNLYQATLSLRFLPPIQTINIIY
jgi:hypothetical protein